MGCLKAGPARQPDQTDRCSELHVSSPAGMFAADGQEGTRHDERTRRGGGAVSGNDRRVAVVIFKCACVFVCKCVRAPLPESRWSSQQMAQS